MILNYSIACLIISVLTFLQSDASYVIPKPVIRVFRPRGFQVSIPHEPGLQQLTFSANLNEPLRDDADAREIQFFKTTNVPDPLGRMTVQDRVARFGVGDKLYYQLMIKTESGDHSLYDQVFTVTVRNIFRQPHYDPEIDAYYHRRTHPTPNKHSTMIPPINHDSSRTTTPKPDQDSATNTTELDECNAKVYSLMEKVSWLVTEVDRLSDDNRLLYKIGNKAADGKKLFLSGKISTTDDPIQVVSFSLNEKLGLAPHIVNAKRSEDNIIQFEVESLDVKLEILRKVDEKLINTKSIKIYD